MEQFDALGKHTLNCGGNFSMEVYALNVMLSQWTHQIQAHRCAEVINSVHNFVILMV